MDTPHGSGIKLQYYTVWIKRKIAFSPYDGVYCPISVRIFCLIWEFLFDFFAILIEYSQIISARIVLIRSLWCNSEFWSSLMVHVIHGMYSVKWTNGNFDHNKVSWKSTNPIALSYWIADSPGNNQIICTRISHIKRYT